MEGLDELLPPRGAQAMPGGGAPRPAVQKLNYTHDRMIDLMIAHPAISGNQLAAVFGYSPSWISTVRSSDAFKARLAERQKELVDPTLTATVEEQFKGIIERSMDILREKLDKPAEEVSDNLCLRAMEIGAKALGYGAGPQTVTNVQVNVDAHLDQMGANLTKLLERKKQEAALPALPVPMEDDDADF